MATKSASSQQSQGAKPGAKSAIVKTTLDQQQKNRFWLMYPPRLITRPVIWELSQKFKVITNVRQASVNDEIGIVCLELEGQRGEIKDAVKWLEKSGVKVEPVEINVIES